MRESTWKGMCSFLQVPFQKNERMPFYQERLPEIRKHTAVFAVSDFYAIELLHFLQEREIRVPEDISIVGFDDSPLCNFIKPALTTVKQDIRLRAQNAISDLEKLKHGAEEGRTLKLPVFLVERQSVRNLRGEELWYGKERILSGGKTQYVMWIDIIGTWLFGVPLGLLAAFVLKLPIAYTYLVLSMEECVRLGISFVIFKKRIWMGSLQ